MGVGGMNKFFSRHTQYIYPCPFFNQDSDVSLSDKEDGPQTGRVAASGTVNSSRSEQGIKIILEA